MEILEDFNYDDLIELIKIIEFEEEEQRTYQFYCSVFPHLKDKEPYKVEKKNMIKNTTPVFNKKSKEEILRDVEVMLMGDRGVKK